MAVLRLFLDICLFAKGPQDIPPVRQLFHLAALGYLGAGFLLLSGEDGRGPVFFQILAEMVLTLAFAYTLLSVSRRLERFMQTATALIGSDALFGFFTVPALRAAQTAAEAGPADIAILGLMLWNLCVTGHILRHALDRSLLFGTVLAATFAAASFTLMGMLFPAPP